MRFDEITQIVQSQVACTFNSTFNSPFNRFINAICDADMSETCGNLEGWLRKKSRGSQRSAAQWGYEQKRTGWSMIVDGVLL